jgi:hypothetical protein
MNSAGLILKLGAGPVVPVLRNFILDPLGKIFAAIIIVIVAAAASAVAKHILQPALLNGPGGRFAANASRVPGAWEQVGMTTASVNGAYHAGPAIITIPARISIGVGGMASPVGLALMHEYGGWRD